MSRALAYTHARASAPASTCYRVLMWEVGSLSETQLNEWKAARTELLGQMRDAGTKGARGTLARLSSELRELSARYIEEPLAARSTADTPQHLAPLAMALPAEESVLGWQLTTGYTELLAELRGEEGIDELLKRLKEATPELDWYPTPLVEAVSAAEATERLEQLRRDTEEADTGDDDDGNEALPFHHVTVLAHEAVDALLPAEGKVIVDATLGGGGHSELILQAGASVWGIDQDPAARRAARKRLAVYGDRLQVVAGNFRNAVELLRERGVEQVDGLLADIGISSPQVDCAERGFSFLAEGPLDMRMNPSAPLSAADIVNTFSEAEIADILWQYGEERASRAIARRIVQERTRNPFSTTTQLAELISSVLPRKGRQHPATRSFQALRIAVNDELGALEALLESGLSLLKSGGRFAVITFHSLEDRAVKRYFDRVTRPEIDRPEWPAPRPNPEYAARPVFRKPIIAGEAELKANPRARSAKLRVIEKL